MSQDFDASQGDRLQLSVSGFEGDWVVGALNPVPFTVGNGAVGVGDRTTASLTTCRTRCGNQSRTRRWYQGFSLRQLHASQFQL